MCVCGGGGGAMGRAGERAFQAEETACPWSGGDRGSWWTCEVCIHGVSLPGLGSQSWRTLTGRPESSVAGRKLRQHEHKFHSLDKHY